MTHTPETVRRCCACHMPAMGVYDRRAYCAAHRPSVGRAVTVDDVRLARIAMGLNTSLKQVAGDLGVHSADLDVALWQWLGREIPDDQPRRYAPDFEGATA
jgi:hypothetical protein